MPYRAPLSDFRFLLDHVVGFDQVTATPRFADVSPETVDAILEGAGRLATEVIAPLNRAGDLHPARLENGIVRTSPGFAAGYRAIADGGWIAIAAGAQHGGMALPMTLATAVNEMLSGACLALQLNPLLTQGQIEALEHHASDALKALYLPRLISGEWSGTMNLTEPQAGSDVGALTTQAHDRGDGTFAITGQKIFITWGDSDVTANVCHLVLARLPDGGPGTRGISLFLVPKFLPDAEGQPGQRNALSVISLEHKLGIHGSPTCVMQFDGATGWLVGKRNMGMAAMFTMMNNARLGVGAQGIGVGEAALQQAVAYAEARVQGTTETGEAGIIGHADVRRMLAMTRADIFSARAIALACAVALDMARATGAPEWGARAALLTPIAKAFGTDVGIAAAETGIQIHGGMGFIEETGAAQFLRDVRITSIYEGTNGIQAMDLVGRKLADGGEAVMRLIQDVQDQAEQARVALPELAGDVWAAAEALREATEWLLAHPLPDRFAGGAAYLRACALTLGAAAHLRAASCDIQRVPLARIAIRRRLPEVSGLLAEMRAGAQGLFDITTAELAA
jgi:alkylation response protein AidB-like acyl-CoA dehydrogenase